MACQIFADNNSIRICCCFFKLHDLRLHIYYFKERVRMVFEID